MAHVRAVHGAIVVMGAAGTMRKGRIHWIRPVVHVAIYFAVTLMDVGLACSDFGSSTLRMPPS
jgi:uncharacterized membrane protein YgdD (TMEM256/DUF423 family)